MSKAIIFDTETTGLLLPSTAPLEKQPRIIEMGAIVVDTKSKRKKPRRLSQLLNPGVPLSPEITKITGLTDADLAGMPTFAEMLPTFCEWFRGVDFLFAHNAPFDTGMLTNDLRRCVDGDTPLSRMAASFPMPPNIICTAQEYAAILGKRPRLIQLYEHVLKKPLPQTHRALDDCEALLEIILADDFFAKVGAA